MPQSVTIRLPAPLAAVSVSEVNDPDEPHLPQSAAELEQMQQQIAAEIGAKAEQIVRQEQGKIARALQALQTATAELQQTQRQIVTEAESQILDLSIAIARAVLNQAVNVKDYDIDPIVNEALGRIPDAQGVVVRLHPADLEACSLATEDQSPLGNLQFVADPSVAPAECRLEWSGGVVESTLDAKLSVAAEGLGGSE